MNNICMVCDTAYQLLICLKIKYTMYRDDLVDVFVGEQFNDASEIVQRLREAGSFNNVYTYDPKNYEKNPQNKYVDIARFSKRLKHMLGEQYQEIQNKNYSIIYMSIISHISAALAYRFKEAKICYYEDGLGSYYIDMSKMDRKHRIIYSIFQHPTSRLSPEYLLLNNISFCVGDYQYPIREIPAIKEPNLEFWNACDLIYNFHNDDYYLSHETIYLSQPNDRGFHNYSSITQQVMNVLGKDTANTLIRLHPREKEFVDIDDNIDFDNRREMWELVCSRQITNSHVLIGMYSTALYTPKLLYGKEPYVIFTFNLYPDFWEKYSKSQFMPIIERLTQSYSDPSKVKTPNSMNELDEILRNIYGRE